MKIGVIDYGMGNLRSVEKAFLHIGFQADIVSTPKEIQSCDKIVLPGVGAFGDAIGTLKERELDKAIWEAADRGKYFLGICLGMQLMFDVSHENGTHKGLSLLPGKIVRIEGRLKIPHMGWNALELLQPDPLFSRMTKPYVYFDHAYRLQSDLKEIISAECEYGETFPVAVQHDRLFGLQFHPEKSGDVGLQILKNFGGLN